MKKICIKKELCFFLFFSLLCFQSVSIWAANTEIGLDSEFGLSADALFDRARSTSSLRDYYRMRLNNPGLISGIDIDLGIDIIGIEDYSVLTEHGVQDFNANIGFSFLRFALSGEPYKILHFRGIDLSGKSVVIGKSFVVEGDGFFDPYGKVLQEDLCVFLFSVYKVKIDFGFLRSRVMSDIDSTGVRDEELSVGMVRFFTPHEADEFALYFNNNLFSGFDVNVILGDIFKSVSPYLDIPAVLRFAQVYPSGGIAKYIQKAAIWGSFSENTASAGCEIEISNLRYVLPVLESHSDPNNQTEKDDNMEKNGAGISFKAEHEFRQKQYSLLRAEAAVCLNSFCLFGATSFIKDPLLEPFGAAVDGVPGLRIGFAYYLSHVFELSISSAFNFVDDIQFMTGSFNHPVTRISLSVRI